MHSSFFTKAAFVAILIMLAVRVPSDVFAKPAVAVEPATTEAPAAFSEPFIGTISMFAGNFAPRGWAFCDGQLLPISEYNALYSILGTTYGGDGRTTFGLPDLRGRVAMHPGNGPGLSSHRLGEKGGSETFTPSAGRAPARSSGGRAPAPNGNVRVPTGRELPATAAPTPLGKETTGGAPAPNQPISVMQPYQTVNFIIALQGVYPSRN